MSIVNYKNCPICGTALKSDIGDGLLGQLYVNCDTCGKFALSEDYYEDYIEIKNPPVSKSEVASYLYYHKDDRVHPYFCSDTDNIPSGYRRVSVSEIINWYPRGFSEKVDAFLLGLASRANFYSEPILFTNEQLRSACFVDRSPQGPMGTHPNAVSAQTQYFENYLSEQKYTATENNGLVLLPRGLERIDSLQQNKSKNTKNVFVAMSFAPEMVPVREAIKEALTVCGFIPRIMDEIEHNHQIVPEMLYEIREARFVIAELTGHNNGAYFEAGYALGCGKEVIQICAKSKFGTDGHFDVKQVNTILWENTEELTNRLIARIKATIT